MPTILVIDGFRFFFYSNEHQPIHVHIEKAEKTAKFNLENIKLVKSSGFNGKDLKLIFNLVKENQELLIQKWNEFFNNK